MSLLSAWSISLDSTFMRLFYHISLTGKDFIEIPTVTKPWDRQLEAENPKSKDNSNQWI